MAQRDEFSGSLRGHDPGQTGHFEDVPFGELAVADQSLGVGGHPDETAGSGRTLGDGLVAHVDHAAGSGFVKVSQGIGHRDLFLLFPAPSAKSAVKKEQNTAEAQGTQRRFLGYWTPILRTWCRWSRGGERTARAWEK